MRHYQRGIATSIILIFFLIIGVVVVSGYFVFSQNQQKSKSISSFDDCAKFYPVMESYPAQCNTPDGRHFVQEIYQEKRDELKSSVAESGPELVVKNFYIWSINCYDKTMGKGLIKECDPEKSGYAKNGLTNIFCAQNVPIKVRIGETILNEDIAQVIAYSQWEVSPENRIDVKLVKTADGWRITSLSCQS